MTSSADTREALTGTTTAPTPTGRATPRTAGRRVAGSRRRTPSTGLGTPAASGTGSATTPRPFRATRKPAPAPLASPAPAPAEATEAREPAQRHTRWWPSLVAALLAAGLLATAIVLSTRPVLTQGERDAAVGSARTSLETLLSYSGASFDAHVAEVTPQLASPFKEEFTKVATTDIKPMAVKNGATVLAKVYDAGVMDTSGTGEAGTTVRVLAFVNQATTTKAQATPAIDQNRVIATMTKVGDRWLISRLEAF